jgi:SAM-dependent methyltransferase
MGKQLLRRIINSADAVFGLRKLMRDPGEVQTHPLAGDRAIEWSWVVAHLPRQPARILDLGCVQSPLSAIAARLGHEVTSVDLREIEYDMLGVSFRRGDIAMIDLGANFDVIINCSMIEHVGLSQRYGDVAATPDGDLHVMDQLRGLLSPSGRMIMTIPVGLDGLFSPFHRVYGQWRLPLLFRRYDTIEQEFWAKHDGERWQQCDSATALKVTGSVSFYALGLFLLEGSQA